MVRITTAIIAANVLILAIHQIRMRKYMEALEFMLEIQMEILKGGNENGDKENADSSEAN